jgi:hypothetical protein
LNRKETNMLAFIAGAPGPMELLLIFVMASVIVAPFWRIFSKAGFSGALSLLMFIPLVNLVMIFVLAFAEWPALREKRED